MVLIGWCSVPPQLELLPFNVGQIEASAKKSVGIFATLDFWNFGSLFFVCVVISLSESRCVPWAYRESGTGSRGWENQDPGAPAPHVQCLVTPAIKTPN